GKPMNPHALVLFVHILSAVVLLGSGLWLPTLRDSIRRAPDLKSMREPLSVLARVSRANPVAALAILVTGLWMGSAGWFGSAWLPVALVVYVVSAVLAVGVVERGGKAMGKLAAMSGEGPVPAALDAMRWSPRWELAGNGLLMMGPLQLFLMICKPELGGA